MMGPCLLDQCDHLGWVTNCVTTVTAAHVQRRTRADDKASSGIGSTMVSDVFGLPDTEDVRLQHVFRQDTFRAHDDAIWPEATRIAEIAAAGQG
jgi:hypothetical protein